MSESSLDPEAGAVGGESSADADRSAGFDSDESGDAVTAGAGDGLGGEEDSHDADINAGFDGDDQATGGDDGLDLSR